MRLMCRLLGHRWQSASLACSRCKQTEMQIEAAALAAPTPEDVRQAYWNGVTDGRKIDRRRAYSLGYQRGAREVFRRWERALLEKAA